MQQILYHEAQGEVKEWYDKLKTAYDTQSLPVLFTYFGPYKEYLGYIGEQLVRNFEDSACTRLMESVKTAYIADIHQTLARSTTFSEFLLRYQYSPEFVQFQKDIQKIILTNIALTSTFITLRECVKGWAIAAKKLPESAERMQPLPVSEQRTSEVTEQFFHENESIIQPGLHHTKLPSQESHDLILQSRGLEQQDSSLTANILKSYIELAYLEIMGHMKDAPYWHMRMRQEHRILDLVHQFPHPINSPINVVLKLTSSYPDFADLIYSISDNFPTLSMQKMILSGYMSV